LHTCQGLFQQEYAYYQLHPHPPSHTLACTQRTVPARIHLPTALSRYIAGVSGYKPASSILLELAMGHEEAKWGQCLNSKQAQGMGANIESIWLVSFETMLSYFVPLLARSVQEFFSPSTAARHAPVIYLTPAYLCLRSCVLQTLISTFPTLFITSLCDFGLLVPTCPVTVHSGPPQEWCFRLNQCRHCARLCQYPTEFT
jgi:hypothetical protein